MRTGAVLLLCVLVQALGINAFIVPDEVPSLLSVIYSNIPTLKKGTDSRLGWGFRLGDRADFQVLVELGPQQYTQKLGNQDENTNSKRNTVDSLADTLYAQRQEEKRQKQEQQTTGGKWLNQWSKAVTEQPTEQPLPAGAKPGLGVGEIDAKSVIPDDAVIQLLKLYRKLKEADDARKEQEALAEKQKENETIEEVKVISSTEAVGGASGTEAVKQ